MKKWSIEDSREMYNIKGWGASYFDINEEGNVSVSPCKDEAQIDLREIVDELSLRDVTPPLLLRFPTFLSEPLLIVALVVRNPDNKLIRRIPIHHR